MPDIAAARRRGFFFVFVATVLWSLAGLFSRMLPHLDIGTVLYGRAAFGGGFGLLLALYDWRQNKFDARELISPMTPVVILMSSTAISAYVAAVMLTSIADVLVIYATLPFLAAGLAYLIAGERTSRASAW
jgi:drug/metabolite transporter (DMT)-like permease